MEIRTYPFGSMKVTFLGVRPHRRMAVFVSTGQEEAFRESDAWPCVDCHLVRCPDTYLQ